MIKISLDNNLNNPIIDDQVKSLDGVASYFQFYCNKIYEKVSDILSGKSGLIRKDVLKDVLVKFCEFGGSPTIKLRTIPSQA